MSFYSAAVEITWDNKGLLKLAVASVGLKFLKVVPSTWPAGHGEVVEFLYQS